MAFLTGPSKRTDGTLWVTGNNNKGQLGLGDINLRSSPVQVGSLTNWKAISSFQNPSTIAIKTDGTLWTWGSNGAGELGLGDVLHRSSPVQVGSLTNWMEISSYNSFAIKSDNTLWVWGDNSFGRLGDGTIVSKSSPVQVGNLTNWSKVNGNGYSTYSVKTDGTLWAWGLNQSGNLGLGDVTHRSSPVQVGSLTNWKYVATSASSTGDASTFAIARCLATTIASTRTTFLEPRIQPARS